MTYSILKLIHISSVLISVTLFFLRGCAMCVNAATPRALRIVPHIVDTVLLVSAIGLVVMAHLNPAHHAWLAAKLVCLVIYIVLGSIALKHGRTKTVRVGAWLAALLVVAYMLKLAVTKHIGF